MLDKFKCNFQSFKMDEAKEKTINLNACDVEACRICLATDVKLNSLQNTHLGTFMQSMADFTVSTQRF